jgi:DivIVA domain-containing protein
VVYDHSARSRQPESETPLHAEIRDVSFPVVVRGYDRRAVDAYVELVNRVIAELEMTRSPESAVRHALERVGVQTSGILQRARETAEEITASAREEADESTARAKAEAAELVVNTSADADRMRTEAEEFLAKTRAEGLEIVADARAAADKILVQAHADADERRQRSEEELAALYEEAQAQMRQLQAETEAIWDGRGELLRDITGIAARLEELASEAATRFPQRPQTEPPEEELLEHEAGTETEPTPVAAADQPTALNREASDGHEPDASG